MGGDQRHALDSGRELLVAIHVQFVDATLCLLRRVGFLPSVSIIDGESPDRFGVSIKDDHAEVLGDINPFAQPGQDLEPLLNGLVFGRLFEDGDDA